MEQQRSAWQSGALWWALAGAMAIALLIPLATVEIPPLLDYPGHLARMFVLAHPADPFLSTVYAAHWSIIPNIAIDAIMPAMLAVLPLYVAGKIMLAVTLLLPVAGTIAYSRASLGTRTLWPLASGLVAYNFLFLLGFMNFLIGLGAALLAAALWIALRRTRPALALFLLAPAMVAIFFIHIFGLALFCLLAGSEELVDLLRHRHTLRPFLRPLLARIAVLAAVMAIPALLYKSSGLADVTDIWGWQPVHWKLVQLFGAFVQYDLAAGLATGLLILALIAVLWSRGLAHVSAPALLSAGVLLALYPFVPFSMKDTGFIDARRPIMAGFLLFAGFAPAALPRRAAIALTATLSLAFALRMTVLTETWQGQNTDVAQLRHVIAQIPPGSRVLAVADWGEADTRPTWDTMPPHRLLAAGMATFMNLPALLVTERDSMWPLLFTDPTKQPLAVRPAFLPLTATEGLPPSYRYLAADAAPTLESGQPAPYFADWSTKFDYVLILLAGGIDDLSTIRPDRLDLVARTDFAALMRVRHPGPVLALMPH